MLSDYLQDNKVSVRCIGKGCVRHGGRSRGHGWAWEIFFSDELLASEKTSTREVYVATSNEAKYTISAKYSIDYVPQNSFWRPSVFVVSFSTLLKKKASPSLTKVASFYGSVFITGTLITATFILSLFVNLARFPCFKD